MHRLTYTIMLAGLVGSLACYRFEPAALEAVPEGAKVRATLTPGASDRLFARHRIEGERLDATVVATNGDHLSLWVASVPITPEFGVQPLYQQVDIPKADVLRVDLRKIDAGKTALVAIGGAAALTVVARATFLGGGRGRRSDGGTVPSESRWAWVLPIIIGRF